MTPRGVEARTAVSPISIVVCSVFFLTGCAVGPDYHPPELVLAPLKGVPAQLSDTRPLPPLEQWWAGFQDPELNRIITRALAENLDLKASLDRVDAARSVARASGAKLLPAMGAGAAALGERQSTESPIGGLGSALIPGFDRNAQLYDVGLEASWEIDVSGGLRRGAEAARDEAEVAEAGQLGVRVSVVADAADAYFQIRGLQARLQVAQKQVETDQRLVDLVSLQKTNGLASEREIAEAEALLAHAQGTIPLLQSALTAQMNRLDVLMGAQPGMYAAELSQSGIIPALPRLSTEAADLLHRRPDILAAERRLAAANAKIGIAIAEYYPKLSLSGLLGFEAMDPVRLFQDHTFQPVGTGGLRWRLFDFGRVEAQVDNAKAAEREALMRYHQTVLSACEDEENAGSDLVQLEIHGQAVEREVASLTRARDDSQEAYKAGLIPLTDVIAADRLLLVAEDDQPRTRADVARAAVRLYRALGGGW